MIRLGPCDLERSHIIRLVLAALFAGCSPAPDASSSSDGASRVSLTATDAGRPPTLRVGRRVTLTLASNPTTG